MKTLPFPKWLNSLANVLLFLTAMLISLYIVPEYFRPYIPLPVFIFLKHLFLPVICFGLFMFFLALLVSNIPWVVKIVLFNVIALVACLGILGVFDSNSGISSWEVLLDSLQVGNYRYNLVHIIPVGDPSSPCYLYKCDVNDLGCEEVSSYVDSCWISENPKLAVNPSTNEVNIFIDNTGSNGRRLVFTYGDQPRSYEDILKLPSYDYYAVYLLEQASYTLYRCETDSMNCVELPFHYDADEWPHARLEMDEQSGNIKFIILKELIYTYGKSPKCYVENCFLTGK